MKYTIELTNKQKKQMDLMCELFHRYIGFNPKLEMNIPIPMTVSPAYKKGFEDGKKQAINELPELANKENEIYNDGYNKGYNSAINDCNAMYEWLHDCFVDFKKFLLEKGFYTDEKFSDGFVVGQLMYDLICDHDIAEVISEFKKWQEEKKKDDEIKVGDEVLYGSSKLLVTKITNASICTVNSDGKVDTWRVTAELIKTGRHFDEAEQLLDKLRGDENE